jgi:hypothetical protein
MGRKQQEDRRNNNATDLYAAETFGARDPARSRAHRAYRTARGLQGMLRDIDGALTALLLPGEILSRQVFPIVDPRVLFR